MCFLVLCLHKDGLTDGRTQTITMSLRCFAVGDKKGIRVEYGRTTFERIAAFTQKINCLHIISAKKKLFACTKKYYY
jgi:hypothetical protein